MWRAQTAGITKFLRTRERLSRGALKWSAIPEGYDAWRTVRDAGYGAVICDLDGRINARPLAPEGLALHHESSLQLLADEAAERHVEMEIRAA